MVSAKNPEKVLWIDDADKWLNLTVKRINGKFPNHFNFDLVYTRDEAIRKVCQSKHSDYDIIITDMRIPPNDDSGLEVIQTVKARHLDIPVIVLTAYESHEDHLKAIQEGAWNYVPKVPNQAPKHLTIADHLVKIIHRAIPQKKVIDKIRDLKAYEEGWYDGERGTPASQEAIKEAETFVKTLPLEMIHSPYISLAADGEICFWWDIDTITIDLGFYGDGSYSYSAELDDGLELEKDEVSPTCSLPQEILNKLQKDQEI